MKFVERVVNDIYYESKTAFQLIMDGVGMYSSPTFKIQKKYLRKRSEYRGIKYTLITGEEYINAINLLTRFLESRLDKIIIKKDDLARTLLSEKNIDDEVVEIVWPELNKAFKLINIYLSEYSSEIYDDIKEKYSNSTIEVVLYNDNILVIGNIKDVLKDAEIIKEKINSLYCKSYYITYCDVYNYNDLKKAYDKTLKGLQLAIKYGVKEVIFDDKKLVLEEVIDSISEDMKNKIVNDFKSKIAKLDNEMIRTIEVFFKCGLNLSESAKELYIHRNTLIYRLDKIQKVTSYDIREFNNAMIFKIIFLYIGRKNNLTVEKI
ncbi:MULTISPECIES: helix-turn-helix domain-containing protein [unclassified Clostridium]|uniref:PucR family transcriptional regulator n=1 Tax=unclassified Clostridium TaxID=2614128 RepID=UPI00189C3D39|nr:helix-turn-helix domain-containing protein [Clostridium sp.]MBP3915980.1 helix-turn-helix domain-containing protein [Clostridium sp.]MEE0933947.1 helix-turn-helix domain-containing protein [Clostridium sp.]